MAREIYCKDVTFSEYSLWHRSKHSGLAMADIDAVEMCIACNAPLILIETVKDVNQAYKKGHSMTKQLAIKASLPAFIAWYKFEGSKPISVKVKKIAPDYKGGYSAAPTTYSFNQWTNYLESKQVEHFPNCSRKELFIKKVSQDPECRRSSIYASVLR